MAADEWPGGAEGMQGWPLDVERCAAALGAPQQSHQALLTLLGLMRRSGLPTLLAWGPELRLLYNEPFAPVLGTRHPDAFGERMQDVWADAWTAMGPAVQRALGGEACTLNDVPVLAAPGSRGARRWFTLSFTTAYGDDGLSAGVLAVASETTGHVALERRSAFELLLADELGTLTTRAEIAREACRLLGVQLDASRVSYLETPPAPRPCWWCRTGRRASCRPRPAANWPWSMSARGRWRNCEPAGSSGSMTSPTSTMCTTPRATATELARRTWSTLEAAVARDQRRRAEQDLHSAAARQSFQLELTDLLRPLTQAEPIIAAASSLLGRHLGLSRVLYAEVGDGEGLFRVRSEWTGRAGSRAAAAAPGRAAQHRAEPAPGGAACLARVGPAARAGHGGADRRAASPPARRRGRDRPQGVDVWPRVRDGALAGLHQQVVRTGQPAAMEHRRAQPGQEDSWLEVRALPARNGGVAVFYRDIGRRKRAEEQLKEADRRKDEFLATLAHELRNPLAPIATAAEMLALPRLDPADARRAGEVIARQAAHIGRLVDELLDISRIKRGVVALQRESLDLRAIVPEAVEQVQPLLASRRHQLVVDLPPAAATVRADRQRLVQVLANLLTNAARYTPPGGRIALVLAVDPARVTIVVRDNGIGMTPQLAVTAFELFTQAERSSDRANGGLGIGLALVRGIVELHGGSVLARSDGPGRGSELVVLLPRADRAPQDAAAPGTPASR